MNESDFQEAVETTAGSSAPIAAPQTESVRNLASSFSASPTVQSMVAAASESNASIAQIATSPKTNDARVDGHIDVTHRNGQMLNTPWATGSYPSGMDHADVTQADYGFDVNLFSGQIKNGTVDIKMEFVDSTGFYTHTASETFKAANGSGWVWGSNFNVGGFTGTVKSVHSDSSVINGNRTEYINGYGFGYGYGYGGSSLNGTFNSPKPTLGSVVTGGNVNISSAGYGWYGTSVSGRLVGGTIVPKH
jgi:hypothetical protein